MTNGDGASTKIDVTSPYYLGPGDKPGDSITPIRLTLTNFDEWSHDVRVALKSRRKFAFVNGTINEPQPPCTQDDWETIHSMLVSWLSHTFSPEVRALLPKYENAKRLWDALHERFSVIDGSRIQQLKASLQDCRQSEGMSIAVYYGKLCQLWDDLDRHEPIIDCKCCTACTSSKQYAARRDSDHLHQFLLGLLPGPYGSLRTVILSQTPLPTVARAFQMLTQEERVRGTEFGDNSPVSNSEISSFNVTSKSPAQMTRTERQKLTCSNCTRKGHNRSMCFDLMDDKPDWWYALKGLQPPNRGEGANSGRGGGRSGPGRGGRGGSRALNNGHRGDTNTEARNTLSAGTVSDPGTSQSASPAAASVVTVYGTPSHTHSGPGYEDDDWHG